MQNLRSTIQVKGSRKSFLGRARSLNSLTGPKLAGIFRKVHRSKLLKAPALINDRKLGRNDDAKREAKIFADLKDDPAALALANQFLRKHPEMSNESVYWHVHELNRTAGE